MLPSFSYFFVIMRMFVMIILRFVFVLCRTRNAMRGSMDFRDALAARLSIIRPEINQVQEFIRCRPPLLTPGIK